MYSNFMFLDRLLFELSCTNTETRKHRNTETQKHGNTHTHTHTHRDSDEYSIVAFCRNATITRERFSEKPIIAFTNAKYSY